MVRYHARIFGRVQGVGFRYFACYTARLYGLTGWVRNLDNGEVELEAQGGAPDVERFLAAMREGSRYSEVDGVELTQREPIPEHGFERLN